MQLRNAEALHGRRPHRDAAVPVAAEYGTGYGDPDAKQYGKSRRRVASAWAMPTLPEHAARVAAAATAGMTAAIVLADLTQLFVSDEPHPVLWGIAGVSSARPGAGRLTRSTSAGT
jgi:hypothetical protein